MVTQRCGVHPVEGEAKMRDGESSVMPKLTRMLNWTTMIERLRRIISAMPVVSGFWCSVGIKV